MASRVDNSPDPIALLAKDAPEMRLFTHVLVRGPDPGPEEIATAGLRLLTGDGEAALFAIDRDALNPPRSRAPPLPGR